MRRILRREPDDIEGDYTGSHHGRGVDYDQSFEKLPFRAMLWKWEQQVLCDLAAQSGARTIVDLACGTGRITELLTRELPGSDVLGVDVAESMLTLARERIPSARFVRADLRRLADVVPDGSVDLITAFRFFANADQPLREAAVQAIVSALRPGGYLLFNNHRNFWSPSYVMRRSRSHSAPGALNRALVNPFLKAGFEIVTRRSLGVLPHNDRKVYLVPLHLVTAIESINARWLSRTHSIGTNTIWLLRSQPDARNRSSTGRADVRP